MHDELLVREFTVNSVDINIFFYVTSLHEVLRH